MPTITNYIYIKGVDGEYLEGVDTTNLVGVETTTKENVLTQFNTSKRVFDTGNFGYIKYTDVASASLTYYGWAEVGSSIKDPVWLIKKAEKSGNVTSELFAGGDNDTFNKIWDDRTTYTYS